MARFYAYENRKWWWFILYLNLAGHKKDTETYQILKDLITIVINQEEDEFIGAPKKW